MKRKSPSPSKASTSQETDVLPSKQKLMKYFEAQSVPLTRRDLTRAFKIKGSATRIQLKALLKDLLKEGALFKQGGSFRLAKSAQICTVEIISKISEGRFMVRPLSALQRTGHPPKAGAAPEHKLPKQFAVEIFAPPKRGKRTFSPSPQVKIGQKALVRLEMISHELYGAFILKNFETESGQKLVGQFLKTGRGGHILSSDRKQRRRIFVTPDSLGNAPSKDVVLARIATPHRRGTLEAHIEKPLGPLKSQKAISAIAIHAHNLPYIYPTEAIELAASAEVPSVEGREDLRDIPLITIDGEDAKDFDDAVWAEALPSNKGWHAIVAIADVSHYVKPGDALDQEAQKRGNSVYLPNHVIPMLPEALSNEMCSLKPDVERACLAVHLWITPEGHLQKYRFAEGLMRSKARLTYSQVHQAMEKGKTSILPTDLKTTVLDPLYGVYKALRHYKETRGTLDIHTDEIKANFNAQGDLHDIGKSPRYDSHRLIEELMITANVAAASALEDVDFPCVYRVHDPPLSEKLYNLKQFMKSAGLKFPKVHEDQVPPSLLSSIGHKAAGTPLGTIMAELLLRTQSKAFYSFNNRGHYGLNLEKYAHFTSPIRRYADLLVHRALKHALFVKHNKNSNAQKESPFAGLDLEEVAQLISAHERRAIEAERATLDRYSAWFMERFRHSAFPGTVTGLNRAGLYITLMDFGVTGFVPLALLPSDYYRYDENQSRVIGRHSRRVFKLGDSVEAEVQETCVLTGEITLALREK